MTIVHNPNSIRIYSLADLRQQVMSPVAIGKITLNDVAYAPDLPFNLLLM